MTDLDFSSVGAITIQTTGEWRVLCLVGDIDAGVIDAFEGREDARPVPVDAVNVSEVTYLAACGVRLLVAWAQASMSLTGQRPKLIRPSRPVRRVLMLTGTYELFDAALHDSAPHDSAR